MKLVLFLEEESAKALLEKLLPRILPTDVTMQFVVFEGKSDLEKGLPKRLRGWRDAGRECRFVVLRDRDGGDCRRVKQKLEDLCRQAGREGVLIRIACRELESWYLGDLKAVESALAARGVTARQKTRKFRDPDALGNPFQELTRLAPGYQKIAGSRAMGGVMDPEHNCSISFNAFIRGIRRLLPSGTGNPTTRDEMREA
ncbi:MAG: DUF4276 family protein [Magnetococcales bacterium]|nr:DUF4276 family protein [Magnetococcales bacterium]